MAFEKRTFQKKLIPPGERISNIELYLNEIDSTFDPRLFEKRARLIDRLNNIEMYLAEKSSDYSARIWEKTTRVLDRLDYIEAFLSEYEPGPGHHVPANNVFNLPPFMFDDAELFDSEYTAPNYAWTQETVGDVMNAVFYRTENPGNAKRIIYAAATSGCSMTSYLKPNHNYPSTKNLTNTYSYNGKTVYYAVSDFSSPATILYPEVNPNSDSGDNANKAAWLMIYGGY